MSTFLSIICILADIIDTLYNSGKVAASAVMLGRNGLSVHQDDVQIGATLKELLHCKSLKEEEES